MHATKGCFANEYVLLSWVLLYSSESERPLSRVASFQIALGITEGEMCSATYPETGNCNTRHLAGSLQAGQSRVILVAGCSHLQELQLGIWHSIFCTIINAGCACGATTGLCMCGHPCRQASISCANITGTLESIHSGVISTHPITYW